MIFHPENPIIGRAQNSVGEPLSLSLVIPLFNEQENIRKVVVPIIRTLETFVDSYELILVDNGSKDGTRGEIEAVRAEFPKVVLVPIDENQGYGGGILSGLDVARGEFLGYLAGDGQIPALDIIKVYEYCVFGHYPCTKVYRAIRGDGLKRKLISFLYNQLFRVMFRTRHLDVNGTPKIFRREVYDRLQLERRDWFIDAEFILKAETLGIEILEVPVTFLPRTGGASKVDFGTMFEFLKNMCVLRWQRRAPGDRLNP